MLTPNVHARKGTERYAVPKTQKELREFKQDY